MAAVPGKQKHLELLVEELFANICFYAYAKEKGEIEITIKPQPITLTFRDWGKPFDPTAQKPPQKPNSLDEAAVGGLGLHFVRTLAKSIAYKRDDTSNITTIQM